MDRQVFKVWISQYALTKGVYEQEVESSHVESMVSVQQSIQCFHKPHWHHTKEEAIAQAEKMRDAQIDKLTKMEFK
ncbi:MAG TPA: hypothetical protein VIM65_17715 [Cyclobacteriaceae bacterium]